MVIVMICVKIKLKREFCKIKKAIAGRIARANELVKILILDVT